MDEARKRKWDITLGMFGPVLTVAGILVGVWQFNAGERNRTNLGIPVDREKKDLTEFRRKLGWNALSSYKSVAGLAGEIAAYPKPDNKFGPTGAELRLLILGIDGSRRRQERRATDDRVPFGDRRLQTQEDHRREVKQHADRLVQTCKESLKTGFVR